MESASVFDRLVKEWGAAAPRERLAGAYDAVRDIPYGDVRSGAPEDVMERDTGTGRGKHSLLKALFENFGYEVKEFLARHDLAHYPIDPWPPALEKYRGKNVPSFHDFLKVRIGNEWRTVDATFDRGLVALGFPALEWDGDTDMALPVRAQETIEVEGDIVKETHSLVRSLSSSERELRQAFLADMKDWISASRPTPGTTA